MAVCADSIAHDITSATTAPTCGNRVFRRVIRIQLCKIKTFAVDYGRASGLASFSLKDAFRGQNEMADATLTREQQTVTRQQLIEHLNEDLSREYQAVIAYVIYSQVLKGAQYMNIAGELEKHAGEELSHALIVSKHIDYLGGMPTATPKPVKQSENAVTMLRADLDNERQTILAYRDRVRECEALGEYGIAEDIREILRQEQEHLTDLATALGENPPDLSHH
jgi:bacterioferritin